MIPVVQKVFDLVEERIDAFCDNFNDYYIHTGFLPLGFREFEDIMEDEVILSLDTFVFEYTRKFKQ